ncbi:hypothetical protein CSKR_200236 [Clonorchis sinensis]|uniref:Uncharacterized protein n=1 Tax=Clonorchis sinensis TaxID=79923 RepID=A0A8T1M0G0_CLOSI|nr:hypothetical protein CSKR_200236 [Clonorchis sinensis]
MIMLSFSAQTQNATTIRALFTARIPVVASRVPHHANALDGLVLQTSAIPGSDDLVGRYPLHLAGDLQPQDPQTDQ